MRVYRVCLLPLPMVWSIWCVSGVSASTVDQGHRGEADAGPSTGCKAAAPCGRQPSGGARRSHGEEEVTVRPGTRPAETLVYIFHMMRGMYVGVCIKRDLTVVFLRGLTVSEF